MLTGIFIHFATVDDRCLQRSWYSFYRQDWAPGDRVLVYANNAPFPRDLVFDLPRRAGLLACIVDQHGDPNRTHAYSVNRALDRVRAAGADDDELVFLTRSDYILAPDALAVLRESNEIRPDFTSGWIYQSAYDRADRELPPFDIDQLNWRRNFDVLVNGTVPGYRFHETHLDAGVWIAPLAGLTLPLNEELSAWGYAQSTWQRQLSASLTMRTMNRYIAFHQQHGSWPRDHALARAQYDQFGGGR